MTARIYRSTSEAEIRACALRGFNIREIAGELGVSLAMLRNTICLLDIAVGNHRKPITERAPVELGW